MEVDWINLDFIKWSVKTPEELLTKLFSKPIACLDVDVTEARAADRCRREGLTRVSLVASNCYFSLHHLIRLHVLSVGVICEPSKDASMP